jgi:hypothetical protein
MEKIFRVIALFVFLAPMITIAGFLLFVLYDVTTEGELFSYLEAFGACAIGAIALIFEVGLIKHSGVFNSQYNSQDP